VEDTAESLIAEARRGVVGDERVVLQKRKIL
jgi:hypothetical protein